MIISSTKFTGDTSALEYVRIPRGQCFWKQQQLQESLQHNIFDSFQIHVMTQMSEGPSLKNSWW